jgi:hypothetical protein
MPEELQGQGAIIAPDQFGHAPTAFAPPRGEGRATVGEVISVVADKLAHDPDFTVRIASAIADVRTAYEIWLEQGNVGTQSDFLESLVGPRGIPGTNISYVHEQGAASAVWTIAHGRGQEPSAVMTMDYNGSQFLGEVENPDSNTTIVRFTAALSGRAILA